jgi:hypothetical protein
MPKRQLTPEEEKERKFKAEFAIRSGIEAARYKQEKADKLEAVKHPPQKTKTKFEKIRDWVVEHPANTQRKSSRTAQRKSSRTAQPKPTSRSRKRSGNFMGGFNPPMMMGMRNPFEGTMRSPIRPQKGSRKSQPFDYLDYMDGTPF